MGVWAGIAVDTGSYIDGMLPPGLRLLGGAYIAGVPTTPGVYQFMLCNAIRCVTYVMVIASPGQEGGWLPVGELPPGLILLPDGRLTGVPTTPGTYAFLITNGVTTRAVTITILPAGATYGFGDVVLKVNSSGVLARRSSWPPERGWIGARAATAGEGRAIGVFYGANASKVEVEPLIGAGRVLPEDMLARDWVFSTTPATGGASFSVEVSQPRVVNGIPLGYLQRGDTVIKRQFVTREGGRVFGEFFTPLNFSGALRVNFYSTLNGEVSSVRFAGLRIRYLPLALRDHQPFRAGTASNWSAFFGAGSSYLGTEDIPAYGAHAVYDVVWDSLPAGVEAILEIQIL